MDILDFYGDDATKIPTQITRDQVIAAIDALGLGAVRDNVMSVKFDGYNAEVVYKHIKDGKATWVGSVDNYLKTQIKYPIK